MAAKDHSERGRLLKAIKYLEDGPRNHQGSLQAKKMKSVVGIWEARVDRANRLTFEYAVDGALVLRTNCRHDEVLRAP